MKERKKVFWGVVKGHGEGLRWDVWREVGGIEGNEGGPTGTPKGEGEFWLLIMVWRYLKQRDPKLRMVPRE